MGTLNKNKRTELINSVLLAPTREPPLLEMYNWLRKLLLAVPTGLEQRRVTTRTLGKLANALIMAVPNKSIKLYVSWLKAK
jgi:hypothetical protein